MPVVLVQNVVTVDNRYDFWKDVEGERYHLPNQYKNKIETGNRFVYYRGTRRLHGRGKPEYFGAGIIAAKYLDEDTAEAPKRDQAYFCELTDYLPFSYPGTGQDWRDQPGEPVSEPVGCCGPDHQ